MNKGITLAIIATLSNGLTLSYDGDDDDSVNRGTTTSTYTITWEPKLNRDDAYAACVERGG